MKIGVDLECYDGENSEGYDDDTIRFWESIGDDGYFYELYVLIDGVRGAIHITDCGVDVNFRSGGGFWTNIEPELIFGKCKSLTWEQIFFIIFILEKKSDQVIVENYSKDEEKQLYKHSGKANNLNGIVQLRSCSRSFLKEEIMRHCLKVLRGTLLRSLKVVTCKSLIGIKKKWYDLDWVLRTKNCQECAPRKIM